MRFSKTGPFGSRFLAAAMPGIAAVLVVLSAVLNSSVAQAQTKPDTQTPRVDRAQAQAMIKQLLREGKIMRADEAKRGMRGIGRSVFQGTKIEEFHIEVIGTLKKVMGGGDLVLIKVLDGPVVKRQSGIIAGMSGSPVYINGKMLGAIAIGFGFPKEPIGGVTPITQMIEGALPDNSETKRTANVGTTASRVRDVATRNLSRFHAHFGWRSAHFASGGFAWATSSISGWARLKFARRFSGSALQFADANVRLFARFAAASEKNV